MKSRKVIYLCILFPKDDSIDYSKMKFELNEISRENCFNDYLELSSEIFQLIEKESLIL